MTQALLGKLFRKTWRLLRRATSTPRRDDLILIYTMGKVGSSTVCASLQRLLPGDPILQVHFLSDYWLEQVLPGLNPHFHENILRGRQALKRIERNSRKRLKIITMVREPIMRDISDYFQNWQATGTTLDSMNVQKLSSQIDASTHDYTLSWFDTEFRNYLGFDIYSVPFDRARGWSIYHLENCDILCLKLEKLNEVFADAFEAFLSLKLELCKDNASEDKAGSALYGAMRKHYQTSREKLDRLYDSRYVKHFYTPAEISAFKARWCKS